MEIFLEDDRIILRKYEAAGACVFCGSLKNTVSVMERNICPVCLQKLRETA